jgi:hypothetical protein
VLFYFLSLGFSPHLSNLILWLLQKNPNSRPSIKELLNEESIHYHLKASSLELPPELIDPEVNTTDYLNIGIHSYNYDKKVMRQQEKAEQEIDVEDHKDEMKEDHKEEEKQEFPSSITDDEVLPPDSSSSSTPASQRPTSAKTPSKTSQKQSSLQSGTTVAPSEVPSRINSFGSQRIRGDRVRGNNKRLPSEKALLRYQNQPKPISGKIPSARGSGMQQENKAVSDEKEAKDSSPGYDSEGEEDIPTSYDLGYEEADEKINDEEEEGILRKSFKMDLVDSIDTDDNLQENLRTDSEEKTNRFYSHDNNSEFKGGNNDVEDELLVEEIRNSDMFVSPSIAANKVNASSNEENSSFIDENVDHFDNIEVLLLSFSVEWYYLSVFCSSFFVFLSRCRG